MKTNKKVFLVTTGSYSDYGIESVWSTEEKAEEHKKFLEFGEYADVNAVEEYNIDPEIKEKKIIEITMKRDGTVEDTHRIVSGERGFVYYDADSNLHWRVATEDQERAIKVVNEKRTIILANDAWDNDELTKKLFSR